MDAAAPLIGEQVEGLREQMEARRSQRGPVARVLGWLLGLELKMRQYEDGKRFCDGVVSLADVEALNRAWSDPAELPSADQLADPRSWLDRAASPLSAA